MLVLLALTALAAPPTATDLVEMTGLGTAARSPDGRWVAFTLSTSKFDDEAIEDEDEDASEAGWTHERQLHLLDINTGDLRQLTHGDHNPGAPQWSPDGTQLAFTRADQLQLLPLAGGDAKPVDTGELSPEWWQFSGNNRIVFSASPDVDDATGADDGKLDGAYKFEQNYTNTQLYVVTLDSQKVDEITDGSDHISDARYSAEANAWLLVTAPTADPYQAIVEGQLVLVQDGQREIIEAEPDCPGDMAWSADGSHAAWVVCDGGPSLTNRVMVRRMSDGETWRLGEGLELTVDALNFTADGNSLLAQITSSTEHRILRFPRGGGVPVDIGFGEGTLRGPLLQDRKGKTALVQYADANTPPSLATLNLKTGRVSPVYSPNPQVSDWDLGETSVVSWKNIDGLSLSGILTRPKGATGPTPLVVMPHGGPDSSSVLKFSGWAQYCAGRGYAVFNLNYRGGLGNGAEFYAANRGRMGEVEQEDIESGVDQLVTDGIADADKLYYGGWSWGGFLTAWTIGHVDRYKAAMAGAAVVDTVNQYVTSD
ncbi:MAG: prolyl oligopeptidase family serine peptidase, partial [Rhodobacterales bacterium]|nr:prolyl oligopeptidase family serine peptidase [Rhodobacterales bacterium]